MLEAQAVEEVQNRAVGQDQVDQDLQEVLHLVASFFSGVLMKWLKPVMLSPRDCHSFQVYHWVRCLDHRSEPRSRQCPFHRPRMGLRQVDHEQVLDLEKVAIGSGYEVVTDPCQAVYEVVLNRGGGILDKVQARHDQAAPP